MTTSTERANIAIIQDALNTIKTAAQAEIKANVEAGNAKDVNAWTEVHGRTILFHSQLTRIGMRNFPEFFGEIVIKGGGLGR